MWGASHKDTVEWAVPLKRLYIVTKLIQSHVSLCRWRRNQVLLLLIDRNHHRIIYCSYWCYSSECRWWPSPPRWLYDSTKLTTLMVVTMATLSPSLSFAIIPYNIPFVWINETVRMLHVFVHTSIWHCLFVRSVCACFLLVCLYCNCR